MSATATGDHERRGEPRRRRRSLRACCGWRPTSGSSTPCATARRRPSRSSTRATTAACSRSAATCSAPSRRPRTPSSTPSWRPTATWWARASRSGCGRGCTRSPATAASACSARGASEHRASWSSRRPSTSRTRLSAGTICGSLLGDLAGLPHDQRAALVLTELGDMSHDEIGDVLGCPREKVKALVFQARSSLIASRNGAGDLVRGDSRAAREPARLLAAAEHAPTPSARVSGLPRVPRPGAFAAQRARADPARRPDIGPEGDGAGGRGGHGRRGWDGVGRGHRGRDALRSWRGNGGRRHHPPRRREPAGGSEAPAGAGGAGGRCGAGGDGGRARGDAAGPAAGRCAAARSRGRPRPWAEAEGREGARAEAEGRKGAGAEAEGREGAAGRSRRSSGRARRSPRRSASRSPRSRRSAGRSRRREKPEQAAREPGPPTEPPGQAKKN